MSGNLHPKRPDLTKKLRDVSHQPGVYLMRDRLGRVIYVGKARDLRRRLAHYFAPSRRTLADLKTRSLIHSMWDFDWHEVRNEAESLLLEGKLIKEFRPRYNVSFRDDKRFLLLKIHREDPFPRFQLCRVRREDGAHYFGPFAHSGALRATLTWLNRSLGLRSCRPLLPGEVDYRHCSDDIIRNCSAPCMARISREDYLARVDEACRILEGRASERLRSLEEEMTQAAAALRFERAAELRDALDNLRKTVAPSRRFTGKRGVPQPSAGLALAAVQDLQAALQLEEPPLVMECFDISNISTTHCVASMVCFRNGLPDTSGYRRYRIQTVSGQDDFAGMAEVVRRRFSRVLREMPGGADRVAEAGSPALPSLIIVDGGKGQLSSALTELRNLGLADLPVIGLAKEREEIFRPGVPAPLVLPRDREALKLLQRIRDEAHRFANSFHQLLMKRRVAESLLDECPGISNRRKQALLKAFGSVTRLRQASPEAIAALPGFHLTLAREILRFLESRAP
ncbi:MAG TPA: excinuclease ABC subunit UvrC [Verrucomicrobiales bacterium]|nr:excinuclease ABC subunit UvrC [Verrucomicrobiales bacterium]